MDSNVQLRFVNRIPKAVLASAFLEVVEPSFLFVQLVLHALDLVLFLQLVFVVFHTMVGARGGGEADGRSQVVDLGLHRSDFVFLPTYFRSPLRCCFCRPARMRVWTIRRDLQVVAVRPQIVIGNHSRRSLRILILMLQPFLPSNVAEGLPKARPD